MEQSGDPGGGSRLGGGGKYAAKAMGMMRPQYAPPMVQEDPYSVQPQPMDSGLASPLAQALMQQMSNQVGQQYGDFGGQGFLSQGNGIGALHVNNSPMPMQPQYAPMNSDPSGAGKSDPMLSTFSQRPQMSMPSYNQANPWGGGGFSNANMPSWMGGQAGNSGIVPPRFGQQKPMQSPILGPTNQQSPYMPPNFRRRLFQPGGLNSGQGGGGVGGGGGGLNLASGNYGVGAQNTIFRDNFS